MEFGFTGFFVFLNTYLCFLLFWSEIFDAEFHFDVVLVRWQSFLPQIESFVLASEFGFWRNVEFRSRLSRSKSTSLQILESLSFWSVLQIGQNVEFWCFLMQLRPRNSSKRPPKIWIRTNVKKHNKNSCYSKFCMTLNGVI